MPDIFHTAELEHSQKSKLVDAAVNGDINWLLHLLKESVFEQSELDAALHSAAYNGKSDSVRVLLAAGGSVYSINHHGESLFVEAVYSGSVDVVHQLIQAGYDISLMHSGDASDIGLTEPIHVAISGHGTPDYVMIETLISAGIGLQCKDVDGDTPLIVACNFGDLRLARLFIDAGCDLDTVGYEGNTAMHRAVENGSLEIVKALVDAGANLFVKNTSDNTPLMIACENGHTDVSMFLLEQVKESPSLALESVNCSGRTCLHLAAASGKEHLVQQLINAGARRSVTDASGNTALIIAALSRNDDSALVLLDSILSETSAHSVIVSIHGEFGRTVLHWAALHGSSNIVCPVIGIEGLEVDDIDDAGDTAMLLAARGHHKDTVFMMLDSGRCDVNAQGDMGRTALHWAVLAGDGELVDRLLQVDGIITSIVDDAGCTPLLLAAANHRYSEMKAILRTTSSDAAVNWAGCDGKTALHWLCKDGYTDLIREMISMHADVNLSDSVGDTPLIIAVKGYHTAAVLELISGHADVHYTDLDKARQALHHAAELGLMEVVNSLLNAGSNACKIDRDGRTPLILATISGHENVAKLLIQHGQTDVNLVDSTQRTCLFYAACNGLQVTAKYLLEAGAYPDQNLSEPSPLIQACQRGDEAIVTLLLAEGAGINYRDPRKRTALMWAAMGGHAQLVEGLLAAGADPLMEDSAGDTALTISCWHGRQAVVRLLIPVSDIEHCEMEEGMTALQLAIAADKSDVVADLLNAGANVMAVDAKGNNSLLTAMMHTTGSDIVLMVLEQGRYQGLDVNYLGDQGRSALHWAVGDPDCLRFVLEHHPDVDAVDLNGASALLLAIAHNRADSANLLIGAGCNFNMVHKDGRSAIHHAAIYGVYEIVKLLLENGVPADTPTADGKMPLLLAAIEGHVDICRVLIQYGCDVNHIYQDAMTPLSAAANGQHHQVLEDLLMAGADPNMFGSKKCSPLMTCILNNDVRGTLMLIQHGARLDQTLDDATKRPIHAAVVNNHIRLLYLLIAAECDVNVLRSLLRDGLVYYFVDDTSFLAALRAAATTPRRLQMLCRNVIRQTLAVPIISRLATLPVPAAIKRYLTMKDLERILCDRTTFG